MMTSMIMAGWGYILLISNHSGYGGTAWTMVSSYGTEANCNRAGAIASNNMRGNTADRLTLNWTCVPNSGENFD